MVKINWKVKISVLFQLFLYNCECTEVVSINEENIKNADVIGELRDNFVDINLNEESICYVRDDDIDSGINEEDINRECSPLWKVVSIGVGEDHTCMITEGGNVWCWGYNEYGQIGDETREDRFSPEMVRWLYGKALQVSGGLYHTCALLQSGKVKCWGDNRYGQLGDGGKTPYSSIPIDVDGLPNDAVAISAGDYYTCVLLSSGGVKCWGDNKYGQLGDGTLERRITPTEVVGLSRDVIAISAGGSHTCALLSSGGVKCWGDNKYGQLGDGTLERRMTPTEVMGLSRDVIAISAGGSHTCALIASGGIKCWGNNEYGQIGIVPDYYECRYASRPVEVKNIDNGVMGITAGSLHTCVLLCTGGVKCWGDNRYGQLGDGGNVFYSLLPVDVDGLPSDVIAISAGGAHTCALMSTGGVKCWGYNEHGQLGDGTYENRFKPVDVVDLSSDVILIESGVNHTCAFTSRGVTKCWGSNQYGQLGISRSSVISSNIPLDVQPLRGEIKKLALGKLHTVALLSTGEVYWWGTYLTSIYTPYPGANKHTIYIPEKIIEYGSGIIDIDAGDLHTCALTDKGEVKCWGWNMESQLGDDEASEINNSPDKAKVVLRDIIKIGSGGKHNCTIDKRGIVKCWGDNRYGQLGDGTNSLKRIEPVYVQGLSDNAVNISIGGTHSCVILSNGEVKCWGRSREGQLGNGETCPNFFVYPMLVYGTCE